MKSVTKNLIWFIFLLCTINKTSSYNNDDLLQIQYYGYKIAPMIDLCFAPLNNENLNGTDFGAAWLINATFENSSLKKADLRKVYAPGANFINTNLERSDISGGIFYRASFHGANLKDTKVKGANFQFARGLTNQQKEYLREYGAINVPVDIEYDLEDYPKEVYYPTPEELTLFEKIKKYFFKKFQQNNCKDQGTQKFDEDFEDYPKEIVEIKDPSFIEKIKQYFVKKYKWYFQQKDQAIQVNEEDLETTQKHQ
ncbi:hypothetical protein GF322_00425 [Candidatus Dependentiae bacterium]|nr:hypothetical protein [Candidatus Dependentiae bacterium]